MSHKHALTVNSGAGILRVLKSPVGVSVPFLGDPATQKDLVVKTYEGVWDTGATGTVITRNVVDALELKPTGLTDVYTAKGKITTNTYLVNIHLPMNVGIQSLKVTEGDLNGADLLIGMDIISMGDFSITHKDGKTKMTFGIPPIESHDYVERIKSSNDSKESKMKCHCGSGRKFKYCHGKVRPSN